MSQRRTPTAYPELSAAENRARKAAALDALAPGADLWVFGYGSLMWKPGFKCVERRDAWLYGYHRAFCVYSHRYRGTAEDPGLVLGLDRGGSCRGIAFRIPAPEARATFDYLWDREMITGVYLPRTVRLRTHGGAVAAQTFVADPAHGQYAGKLPPAEAVRLIRRAHGSAGANTDYLKATVEHLDELGIGDGPLHRLQRLVAG